MSSNMKIQFTPQDIIDGCIEKHFKNFNKESNKPKHLPILSRGDVVDVLKADKLAEGNTYSRNTSRFFKNN